MHCCARLLAHHPYVVIAAVTLFAGACLVISFSVYRWPDFRDPQLGFEPRGTELAQRATAWDNLMEATKGSGVLTLNPSESLFIFTSRQTVNQLTTPPAVNVNSTKTATLKVGVATSQQYRIVTEVEDFNKTWLKADRDEFSKEEWHDLKNLNEGGISPLKDEAAIPEHVNVPGFFCGKPSSSYARVVFQSVITENLYSVSAIRSMCGIENFHLRSVQDFDDLCITSTVNECCRTWSLGNYITLLRNKSSCDELGADDLAYVLETLHLCSKFYYNLQLKPDCFEDELNCRGIPPRCIYHDAVFVILHYLTDTHFLNPQNHNNTLLKYAMAFVPIACSSKSLPYFRSLESIALSDGITEIVAMDMGLKYTLFDEYLVHDTLFLGLAAGLILILMWMYTNSLFITIMTVIAIMFSLGIAYFLYTALFKMKFFPFMNLLTTVIIIGIGADDAFIYCKVWACAKSEKNNGTLVKLVNDTLKHATLSMFVTSLTTAAAFYASYVSSITAIRCFSICLY